MGKLHELLAVEPELKAAYQREMHRLKALFSSGDVFRGLSRKYQPLEEDGQELPGEFTNLATTVDDELGQFGEAVARYIDAVVQKEVTNTSAYADVMIDNEVLWAGMPATALLALERHVGELKKLYTAIPTNDPTEKWELNEDTGVYQSAPRITNRDEKVRRAMVLYEATPEHPAQVDTYTEPKTVGTWTTIVFSGMLSISERRERLERLDKLLVALKEARMRANCTDAADRRLGESLLRYINEG